RCRLGHSSVSRCWGTRPAGEVFGDGFSAAVLSAAVFSDAAVRDFGSRGGGGLRIRLVLVMNAFSFQLPSLPISSGKVSPTVSTIFSTAAYPALAKSCST